jgi:hypothetical protein
MTSRDPEGVRRAGLRGSRPWRRNCLTGLLREVRERNARAQAAWEESRRLEAALRALEGERSRARPQRKIARPRSRSSGGRAPRGQTRDTILRVVADRPGATAAEIAAVANLDRRATQSTLARLTRQGTIER